MVFYVGYQGLGLSFFVSEIVVYACIRGEFGVPKVVVAVEVSHHEGIGAWYVRFMEGVGLGC